MISRSKWRLHGEVIAAHLSALRDICDPDALGREAKADQAELVAHLGGAQAILEAPAMTFFRPPETSIQF